MNRRSLSIFCLLFSVWAASLSISGQIPGQLAQDFTAGSAPSPEEIAALEKEVSAKPDDLRLVRKLGKGYFFQFFDEGDKAAVPKAQKILERALTIRKDDAEAMAYLGSLHILRAQRLEKGDAAKEKASYDAGFALVREAEKLDPEHGAVLSVASASYLWLPDSYGMVPRVIEIVEGMRKAMGPMFKKFAHHGQQRLLLTLGQAYLRTNQPEKARVAFGEALEVNEKSREAALIRAEIKRMNK
ncbi:MAG: hypothetical protein WBO10_01490 [Pyrinomonadaceae bacterium]